MASIVFTTLDWVMLFALIGTFLSALGTVSVPTYHAVFSVLGKKYNFLSYAGPWLFGAFWVFTYGLVVASVLIYWKLDDPDNPYYVSILSLAAFNIVFKIFWTPLFFHGYFWTSIFVGAGVALSGLAISGLMGYRAFIVDELIWISFAFFLFYTFAVIIILGVNFYVLRNKKLKKEIRDIRKGEVEFLKGN